MSRTVTKVSECRDGMVLRARTGGVVELWLGYDGRTLLAASRYMADTPASRTSGLFPAEVIFDPRRTADSLGVGDLNRVILVDEAYIEDGRWMPGPVRIAGVSFTDKGVKVRPGRKKGDPRCGHTDYDYNFGDVIEFDQGAR